jgi:hypothetical protein
MNTSNKVEQARFLPEISNRLRESVGHQAELISKIENKVLSILYKPQVAIPENTEGNEPHDFVSHVELSLVRSVDNEQRLSNILAHLDSLV